MTYMVYLKDKLYWVLVGAPISQNIVLYFVYLYLGAPGALKSDGELYLQFFDTISWKGRQIQNIPRMKYN